PVVAGEPQIVTPQIHQRRNVLRLEDLELDAGIGCLGPVRSLVLLDHQARLGEQRHQRAEHPALGQRQRDGLRHGALLTKNKNPEAIHPGERWMARDDSPLPARELPRSGRGRTMMMRDVGRARRTFHEAGTLPPRSRARQEARGRSFSRVIQRAMVFWAALGVTASPLWGQRHARLIARIDSLALETLRRSRTPGLSLGVARGKETSMARGYGFARLK